MPFYDYRCQACQRPVRLFFSYAAYGAATPVCPHCQSNQLKRRISRVAVAKSEDARLDNMMSDADMAGLDEEDPRALGRFMRQMSREMGEDLGDEFGEVVDRLERGESPEEIEKVLPDLSESVGGGDSLDDF